MTSTFDFNNANAPDNPLKELRPFVSLTDPNAAAPVYICPGAQPTTKAAYAPVGTSSTALMINQLVMNRGADRFDNPARTVVMQENYALMSYLWYEWRLDKAVACENHWALGAFWGAKWA